MNHKLFLGAACALLLSACATGPQTPVIRHDYVSQNQDSRSLFIVLHYTVLDWEKSLKVLTTGGQVSAHYLVREEPAEIYQLVDENRRSWHAGASYWAGNQNLNSSSIGIEIVNAGWVDTPGGRVYAPFPQKQIEEVIKLVRDIQKRHNVKPERIIGHADIAPGRKQDPGPMFPWKQLHEAGLIPWPDPVQVAARKTAYEAVPADIGWAQDRLGRYGFNIARSGQPDKLTSDAIATFQMKYRPADYGGVLDAETAALIDVATTPGGMLMAPAPAPTGTGKP
ncbi:N-acetylmuramoyl-L-alanine amidase [Roseateles violae]|uniref:N-acetylmuramoyl-L-alanine amidase n=1 Tax=Roseateles violae TaxID=3058042 RepID=A0ABT8DT17_9BURK|nr:N-acetylmuramoyl-L-alanine amidase [Pelomonas sp. PFR6]MDN3919454.1 N-acetylmuramoyl-L-alanine amidase [Pelomonas sp. PFR6]